MGYLFGTFFGVSFPSPPLLHVLVFFGFSTLLSIGFLLPAVYVCVCQQRLLVYLLWWSILKAARFLSFDFRFDHLKGQRVPF